VAFAVTVLTPAVAGTATTLTSGTVTPTAAGLLIVSGSVTGTQAACGAVSVSSTLTGQGAWTIIQSAVTAANQVSAFVAYSVTGATPGTGTVTVTFPAATADSRFVVEEVASGISGTPVKGSVTANAGATASTPSLTLSVAPLVADISYGCFASRNGSVPFNPGGTLVGSTVSSATANPRAGLFTESRTGSTSTTVNASGMGVAYNAGVGLIITSGGGGGAALLAGAGTVAGISAVSGTVSLAGTSAATGTATALLPATGSVAGISAVSGSATIASGAAIYPASGTVAGTSTAVGSTTATLLATGVAPAVSAVVGSTTGLLLATGSAFAVSTAVGSAVIYTPPSSSGIVVATSGTRGAATLAHASYFTGPSIPEGIPTRMRPFSLIQLQHGGTVLKTGGFYKTIYAVSDAEIVAADIVYLGGHTYVVSDVEALALVAAGYTVVTGTDPGGATPPGTSSGSALPVTLPFII
jgi:hypothetical protein